ncbi:MAG: class II fructose-bisphosphatase, partial [Deltaproteobacteria bacterium]|nr:class II fructose-bisphosphatase [Deltaproteobacteria bacterium]
GGTWRDETPSVDIALDPLEGTTITARGDLNAISVVAIAEKGCFLHAPDTYMSKIAVGGAAKGAIDLTKSVSENLKSVASALKKKLNEMTVIILDRERHKAVIQEIRDCGCRIILIRDGDVAASIATALEGRGVDMLIGAGGAPEGVISAAALKCLDGDMQGKLAFRNDMEKERALEMGIHDLEKIYAIDELARGHVMFAATGVTDGQMLEGIRTVPRGVTSNSVVMRSETGTIRFIKSIHTFKRPFEF